MYQKSQAFIVHSKGDIHGQKIKVKKYIFVYSYPHLLNQEVYFHIIHIIHIIRKASYSILYVLNFMDIIAESILQLNLLCIYGLSSHITRVYCDNSISSIRNEEQGSGTRTEEPEPGMRIWNGERNTLQPCVNSVIIQGNEDPPCVHMGGGTSDPLSRCLDKSKCIGNDAFGDVTLYAY